MRSAWFSIVAVTMLPLLFAQGGTETPAPASGIEGTIRVSPIHGGPIRAGEQSAAPAANVQFVVKAGDVTVATFTTDAAGNFHVALPPGHYVVLREGAAPRIGRWRFEADVSTGEVTKVTWTADTGMR